MDYRRRTTTLEFIVADETRRLLDEPMTVVPTRVLATLHQAIGVFLSAPCRAASALTAVNADGDEPLAPVVVPAPDGEPGASS